MNTKTKTTYVVPDVKVFELATESIICQSNPTAGGGGQEGSEGSDPLDD